MGPDKIVRVDWLFIDIKEKISKRTGRYKK